MPDRQLVNCRAEVPSSVTGADVRYLHWLETQISECLVDKMVFTTGTRTIRRPDGVAVVPLDLLGP